MIRPSIFPSRAKDIQTSGPKRYFIVQNTAPEITSAGVPGSNISSGASITRDPSEEREQDISPQAKPAIVN